MIARHVPPAFDTYLEPFVGGGAMFCYLWSTGALVGRKVVLADSDADLMLVWAAIRDNVHRLIVETQKMLAAARRSSDAAEKTYARERAAWNEGDRTPARNLYLRTAAFNGLWRVNSRGAMNTPSKRAKPGLLDVANLEGLAMALAATSAVVRVCDFRDHIGRPGLLAYGDPPYYCMVDGKKRGFTSYTREPWTETDFIDLVLWTNKLRESGATTLLSHADTQHARGLIARLCPGVRAYGVWAPRAINSDGAGRGPVGEIVAVGKPLHG